MPEAGCAMGNKNSAIDAKLKAKEWQWQLKTEVKHLDREIKKIQADEARLQREIQDQAQKGNVQAVQLLARSVLKSRKAVARLEKTKASMHAVNLQLTTSIASMSTSASLRLSADVMKKMNAIAKMPEVGATMEDMRREMARCADAEDSIEEALREEGEEEEAAIEVQRVLEEMALDQMGPLAMPAALASSAVPAAAQPAAAVPAAPERQAVAVGVAASSSEPAKAPAAPAPAPAAPAPPPAAPAAPGPLPPAAPAAPHVPPVGAAPPAAPAGGAEVGYAPAPAAPAPPAAPGAGDDDELMRRLANLKM